MNRDKLAPDNNGASKIDQSKIVMHLLLKSNEQLAETVEKRVSDFNHPTSGLEGRVALYFFALLTSGTNMGGILTCLNGLGTACIASIQAEILRMPLTDCWTRNGDFILDCCVFGILCGMLC